MAAKTEVLFTATEGPFEGKHGRALVEVYSPAHRFGLHGRRWFLKSGFALKGAEKKKKRKFGSPTYFFLISIYTCWNNVILGGNGRSGE